MGLINYILKVLAVLFLFIVMTKIFMAIAGYIGKQFGFGRFFINLWERAMKRKSI